MAIQPTQLENITNALAGFSAGIGGQLPQFMQQKQNAAMQNQQMAMQQEQFGMQKQQFQQQQQAAIRKQLFEAAQVAQLYAEEGNYQAIIDMGLNVLSSTQGIPGIDPTEIRQVTNLATGARNGSEESAALLNKHLSDVVRRGRLVGDIRPPDDVSTKVVGNVLVNDQTGEVLFSNEPEKPRERAQDENGVLRYVDDGARVFPQVAALDEVLSPQDKFDRAKTIRSEIVNETKDFTQIANSWDRIAASADDPSAAGDLALIFNFMKMLDPGSTVREGEFAQAAESAGLGQRIIGIFQKVDNGQRLTEDQRTDFFNQSQNIFNAAKERTDSIKNEYVRLGEKYGLTADDILIDRGEAPVINQAPVSGLKTITTQAERDALPAGSEYMMDGVRYRKR